MLPLLVMLLSPVASGFSWTTTTTTTATPPFDRRRRQQLFFRRPYYASFGPRQSNILPTTRIRSSSRGIGTHRVFGRRRQRRTSSTLSLLRMLSSSDDDFARGSVVVRQQYREQQYERQRREEEDDDDEDEETYEFWDDKLSLSSFRMDLRNLCAADPRKAQDALEIMEEMHSRSSSSSSRRQQLRDDDDDDSSSNKIFNSMMTVQPDSTCYAAVVEGWIEAGMYDSAEELLYRMEQLQDESLRRQQQISQQEEGTDEDGVSASTTTDAAAVTAADPLVAPTELTYLLVVQAWAGDSKNDILGRSAERAEALMRHMQNDRGMPPSVKVWDIVLEGWCKRAGIARGAVDRAEALLKEMEATYWELSKRNSTTTGTKDAVQRGSNLTSVPPNVLTYTSFIGGLSRSREKNLAQRAEAVLDRMERHGVQPDAVAYTSVLNCWSKAVGRREREMAATRALLILDEMERSYAKEMYHVKPSLITYATAISAIGNSLDPKAPQMAEEVLERMYRLSKTGAIANLKPTTQTFNAVLLALSRAQGGNRLRYARRAEQILNEMTKRSNEGEKDVQPDVRTWAAVLRAWSRSGAIDAAENAQRVLDKLEEMHSKGETQVRPNFVCYTTVMGAWGTSRKWGALDKVESILRRMEDAYEETLEADIRPNTVSYVTAIDSIVRRGSRDMAQRAQDTVDRMARLYAKGLGHVRPTTTIFNCLIHAYSKSRDKDAAAQAEKIFKWMESQYRSGDELVRPDVVSLCAVLNAWANQGTTTGAKRALQIWEHMKSISLEDRGFELTITMPNIVIKAIARSKDPNAVEKAEQILENIEEDFRSGKSILRPDVTTASSVINAAAYYTGDSPGRARALDTALRTFRRISKWKGEQPNNITYGTLFKAISNLMPHGEEREALVRSLFDQCCEEGNVDGFVMAQIRHASPQFFRDLVAEPCGLSGPGADVSVSSVLRNIPSEWSGNVIE